eukprot:comp23399_c0_seq1/m.38810 comp23399_c0_seq1/g.38810  ORF comp23399_c0_seq1/g.38810 comp23399_c0_seq1/m.38810 type:complete len:540 (-) comp23399_c0_seq1:317-1936(-)
MGADQEVWMLDYGAGNVRSVINAVQALGYTLRYVENPDDILNAPRLLFPGVGVFGSAMAALDAKGYTQPLKAYLASGRPFFGICVGMQVLFAGSDESPGVAGLGVIPTQVRRFPANLGVAVPHMGWNGYRLHQACTLLPAQTNEQFYFVHSYMASPEDANRDWVAATTDYGVPFVSAVCHGRVMGTQFHPEKSGKAGLELLRRFLAATDFTEPTPVTPVGEATVLARRVIACLDVRANDQGDLVVTKGDQYDVREKGEGGDVRNLGKPVDLAERYYHEGADEITFLNITSFRDCPVRDLPMLEVLRRTSERVFVPLTIGGGIRDITDPDGTHHSAVDVAAQYFRSGADKVSIGSDAVYVAEAFYANNRVGSGQSSIEQIAQAYGNQAVVISVDPRRVYVKDPADAPGKHVIATNYPGPNGERYCWYQCTVKGGREARDLDAHALVVACEALGAGEILLNCMDKDGTNSGFDRELVGDIKRAVSIPVIASSGAGGAQHFSEVFEATGADAALSAGIFHRREVPIQDVKAHLAACKVPCRQ